MSTKSTKSAQVSTAIADLPSAESYAAMSRADKAAARSAAERLMRNALRTRDFALAEEASTWLDSVPGSTSVTERAEVDYTQKIAERIAHLRTVAHLLASGDCVPEGIESSAVDYERLHSLLANEEDLVDEQSARKDAVARITRRTERNAIQEVIDTAFEDLPSGTFLTIAQVATKGKHPRGVGASGAIAARVDWDTLECSLDGVEPVERTANRARGFVKI